MEEALDLVARTLQGDRREHGPDAGGALRLGPVDDPGRLRRHQVDEGRSGHQQHRGQRPALHGQRRGRLPHHLRQGRADGLLRRLRAGRRLRPLGQQHGRDAPGALLPHLRAQAQRPPGSRSSTSAPAAPAPPRPPTSTSSSSPRSTWPSPTPSPARSSGAAG